MKSFSNILLRGKHIDVSFTVCAKVRSQVSPSRLTVFAGVGFTNGYFSSGVNHGAGCRRNRSHLAIAELSNSFWTHNLNNRTPSPWCFYKPAESNSRNSQRNYKEIEKFISAFIIAAHRFPEREREREWVRELSSSYKFLFQLTPLRP